MRREFFETLHAKMKNNKYIIFVTADLAWGLADKIRKDYPDRFFNVQAAEQSMVDIGCGMSLSGKTVFLYTITPFFFRCAESLKYADDEGIKIICVGSGRDDDYKKDGASHWTFNIKTLFDCFPTFVQHYPDRKEEIEPLLDSIIGDRASSFLSLKR